MASKKKTTAKKTTTKKTAKKKPVLLSGGNPQIAKGDGDVPIQAYLAAMPEWKAEVGARLDALIVDVVPDVKKAVRWNTPFYGIDGNGWFLSFHCFTKYIKVAFHNGNALTPPPPIASKHEMVRYLHLVEGEFDDEAMRDWVAQSAKLPGEKVF